MTWWELAEHINQMSLDERAKPAILNGPGQSVTLIKSFQPPEVTGLGVRDARMVLGSVIRKKPADYLEDCDDPDMD